MDRQDDEIAALESIYDHLFQFDNVKRIGIISIPIALPNDGIEVISESTTIKVFHLPPISIKFKLHDDYPTKRPPQLIG